MYNRVFQINKSNLSLTGIATTLTNLGPVYAELDEASLKEAEAALEKAKGHVGDPWFQYTRVVAQLGRVKQLNGKLKESRKILEEVRKETKLPHDHIGEIVTDFIVFIHEN